MATTTTSTQSPAWMIPMQQDYLARAQEMANNPYVQSPGTYTPANQTLQQGWQATANRAINGSPVMGAANTQLQNTISGGMMAGNPYLTQSINDAQGDLARNYNLVNKPQWDKAMSASGSFGNSGVSQYAAQDASNLQRNMGRIGTDMRMQGYNTERNNQMQATLAAPQFAQNDYLDANALMNVGQQMQGFNQAGANQNQKWWEESQNFPRQQMGDYGAALGMNTGQTQTQNSPDPSRASQLIGGAMVGSQVAPWFQQAWNSWGGTGGTAAGNSLTGSAFDLGSGGGQNYYELAGLLGG